MEIAATQHFNGGIIFVSFVISVIGSMTTLELMTKRTHIQGKRNWYLLLSAALSMGSVGIWSMHFIGNNSLTLMFPDNNDRVFQLAYSGGFTFASLIVSIACMFISFSFVGISEHVQVYRILLSGFFAGLGIAVMHYLGQFAIEYFHVVYKPPYVVGAVIIACTAVTAALWIFFKLREQWMNQWYKRLGCAAIMGVAVCGMHYTAMVGTEYYDNGNGDGAPPPNPLLPTPALIGVICGVVVIACCGLLYAGVRCSMQRMAESSYKGKRRLVVDLVLFDEKGRIMVDVDGLVPSEEVLSNIQFQGTQQEFSSSHPLFSRLFQVVAQWSTTPTLEDYDNTSHSGEFNAAERRFHEATSCLMETLDLEYASELGLLYESVLKTNTISQPSLFQQQRVAVKHQLQGIKNAFSSTHLDSNTQYDDAYALSDTIQSTPTENTNHLWSHESKESLSTTPYDQASIMESPTINDKKKKSSSTMYLDYQERHSSVTQSTPRQSSAAESEDERHIVLVRQLAANKDIHRFMIQGYRFADATFIATTMAAKLCVPNDYLLSHFRDMHLLAQSSNLLQGPASPRVMVGVLGLIDEGQTYNDIHLVVDKRSRYGFPLVNLEYDDTGGSADHLLPEEKHYLYHVLQGQSLNHMINIDKYIDILPRADLPIGRSSTNTLQTLNPSHSIASSPSSIGGISTSSTVKPNSPVGLSITDQDQRLVNTHYYQQMQQDQHIQTFSPTISPSSQHLPVDTSSVTRRFTKAMETASRKLVKAIGTNGIHLGLSDAILQAEVLDLPAFSLTTGPCTLILFRTCLRTRGIVAAIQQHASTQPIRCIPYLLGSFLGYAISQRAVDQYQKSMGQSSWATELKQQMLYGSFSNPNHNSSMPSYYYSHHYQHKTKDGLETTDRDYGTNSSTDSIHPNRDSGDGSNSNGGDSSSRTQPKRNDSSSSNRMDMITSLPPPPRVKRSRQPASLEVPDKQNSAVVALTLTSNKHQPMNAMESSLVILPAKDRFLWWDQAIVECMHSISS